MTQSLQGVSVPIIIGTAKVPGLLIWFGDWNVGNAVGNGKTKGKGGAGYVYNASWMAALCEGPIFGVNAIWTESGRYWPQPADPLTLDIQATPQAPTLGSAAGGTLPATTYYATVTYTATTASSNDESAHSTEASLAVAADNVLVVDSPPAQTGAAGYNVYVGTASGAETLQNTTPIAIGTNWTMPVSGSINTGPTHPPNPHHVVPPDHGPVAADFGILHTSGPYRRIMGA
ncbi:MAG: hypothetical protein ACRD2H_05890 [Terriglobales bacterium]